MPPTAPVIETGRRADAWERPAWAALLIVAASARLWDLGTRVMSHDESLHAYYSFELFAKGVYRHDPTYHGPLLYHVNALVYFLFGVSDFTARLAPTLLGVGLVAAVWLFRRWLGAVGAFVAAALMTISPSLLFYSRYIREDIYVLLFSLLWAYGALRYVEERRPGWLLLVTVAMSLSFISKETSFMFGSIAGSFFAVRALWPSRRESADTVREASADLAVLMLTLVLPFASGFGYFLFRWNPLAPATGMTAYAPGAALVLGLFAMSIAAGLWRFPKRSLDRPQQLVCRRHWAGMMALFWTIEIVFFTGFFTNIRGGLHSGIVGSLGYWLGQHEVGRAGQPWFYYLVIGGLYDFLPVIAGLVSIAIAVLRRRFETWMLFVIWWTVGSWLLFGWAGERMPWLLAHQVLPLCLLAGWGLARAYRDLLERPLAPMFKAALATAAALVVLVLLMRTTATPGFDVASRAAVAAAVTRVAILAGALWFLLRTLRPMSGAAAFRAISLGVLGVLLALTVRTSFRLAFVNYDKAAEPMSYAQASTDVKTALREIGQLSERTVGERAIEVAYDDESSWPLVWYLRDFPNARTWVADPALVRAPPVIIVGPKNKAALTARMPAGYIARQYILYWWPLQEYVGLNASRIVSALTDPATRQHLWQVFFHREYGVDARQWPMRREFWMYVRGDVAAAAMPLSDFGPRSNTSDYTSGAAEVRWQPERILAGPYAGSGLRAPTGLALGADGALAIADGGNHRVVVLEPDASLRRIVGGGQCVLTDDRRPGCIDADANGPLKIGDGQFNEPWGVAIGVSGELFVADTWNGRLQAFDSRGGFIRAWGRFGQPPAAFDEGSDPWLYGPRAVVIDPQGQLVTSDTGNKRLLRFSDRGAALGIITPAFAVPDTFDEPVGLALDANDTLLIADAWNRRIVRLDRLGRTLAAWRVPGWTSRAPADKPSVAVDDAGLVYASDPESGRVLVFTPAGNLLAVLSLPSADNVQPRPTGLAVDLARRQILVADQSGNRVLAFGFYRRSP